MIAVDTNLLVYAHRSDVIWHDKTTKVITPLLERRVPWAIAWPCVHEFISVVTNRRVYELPTPLDIAFSQLEEWAKSPGFQLIAETNDHINALKDVAMNANISGGQIHDARIAAICLQHGVTELWTADRDFSRYPKLRTRNPLVG